MDIVVQQYLDRYAVSPATRQFLQRQPALFIDGDWRAATDGQQAPVHEPSTAGLLCHLAMATPADLELAVAAARRQSDGGCWSQMKPLQRERLLFGLADLLEAHADQLAEIEAIDVGKSVQQARQIDVQGSIDTFRYFAGWASKIHGRSVEPSLPGHYLAYTRKEAVGVVGIIVPWNFPLQTLAWKLGAALAAGCSVVVKPSEQTSLSALRFAELVQQADLPPGVVNILTGRGSVIGAAMAGHPGIDKLSFTGSTPVGRLVGRAAMNTMQRLTLELGGKSPVLVFADCDLKASAQAVANGAFFNAGQVCDAGSRAYVQSSIYPAFLAELKSCVAAMRLAPGLDPDCFIGPLVSAQQQQRVLDYIAIGQREGAELICGGQAPAGPGHFVLPTVFAHCRQDMRIVREEIFGPVLVTAPFDDEASAVALANDSVYGLAATIYSRDLDRVHRLIPQLRAGTVYVNSHGTLDPALPFGGYKQSGYGKDLGPEQLEQLLETKAVWITLS